MHRLHRVNKARTAAAAFRRIPWSILNFLVFAALSLWIAARRMTNAISRRGT